jgi:Kef-type K+ transport system membrane component KefB
MLLALGGLMHAGGSFAGGSPGIELAFGYLLLTSFFAGSLVTQLAMPRLTGYIVAGVVVGPSALALIDRGTSTELRMIGDVATAMIALNGGAELDVRAIRPLFGTIRGIVVWAVLAGMIVLTGVILAIRPLVPFLDALSFEHASAVAVVLAVALVAQSPAVVMALIGETGAQGPLTRTILAVVVIADLVVVIAYGVAASISTAVISGHADVGATAIRIGWEVAGSIVVGVAVGACVGHYLRVVRAGIGLFTLMVCFTIAQVAHALALDPLIVMLAAGIWVQNVSRVGAHDLIESFEGASLPIYLVFFALAGAKVDLEILAALAVPVAVIVGARALVFFTGVKIAARRSGAEPSVARYAWLGLLPQAGLALAIADLVRETFPAFGGAAFALVVGVVGANQLIAPILLRLALVWSGEAGGRARAPSSPGRIDDVDLP